MKQLMLGIKEEETIRPEKISNLIAGIEKAYVVIQKHNPDAGDVLIVVYQSPSGSTKMGHFWRGSWFTQDERGVRHEMDEILISSHILAEGADAVMETLLHEAVHSIAKNRGIQDISRQNRWHNNKFRKLAHEVGLTTDKHPTVGCTTGELDSETAPLYVGAVKMIEEVLKVFQDLKTKTPDIKKPRKKLYITADCPCGRSFRMKPAEFNLGRIECIQCGEYFVEILED